MFANGASLHQVTLVLDVSPKTIYKDISAEARLALAAKTSQLHATSGQTTRLATQCK